MGNALCPNCRKPLLENARFCMECGSRIDYGITRKELGEDSLEASGGLKVNRSEVVSSPFYGKYNSLKDKIINPKLLPLPEKRSFLFKSWEEIKNNSVSDAEKVIDNQQAEVAQEEPIEEIIKQPVEEAITAQISGLELIEPETTVAELIPAVSEEILTEDVIEEVVKLQEESTDFEALKELFTETEEAAAEEPVEEAIPELVLESEVINPETSAEEIISEVPEKILTENAAEEVVELQEEDTGCEALKELFTETEEAAAEEPTEEIIEKSIPKQKKPMLTESEEVLDRGVLAESSIDKESDLYLRNISEKVCNQSEEEIEISNEPSKKAENRIITSTVGGGFKRRESQAEAVKEITSFFCRKRK